jgi:RNA polymerase sigma-70 factor (ECF subfamily)
VRALDFQTVYDEFHDRIRYYAGRLVGEADAQDVTQEVFVKVDRHLAGFEGKSSLSAWIYRIATNTALDRLRSKAHRQDRQTSSLSDTEDGSDRDIASDAAGDKQDLSADREAVRAEMTECIREFVGRLPPDYQTVIVLSELEELRNREIADILDVSLHTVKIRLHRARARLKQEFESGCELYRNEDNTLACDRKNA